MKRSAFTTENQPDPSKKIRGKAKRTMILEALKRAGKTEEGFYDLLIERATNPEDSIGFSELLKRLHPQDKPVAPMVQFEIDAEGDLFSQSKAVMKGVADGDIPPDIGNNLINSLASMIKIQEITELESRIQQLEQNNDSNKQG